MNILWLAVIALALIVSAGAVFIWWLIVSILHLREDVNALQRIEIERRFYECPTPTP